MQLRIGGVLDDALALLAIFEIIALGQLALYPFSLYTVGSFAWYQAQALRGLSPLAPLLMVPLLYAWLARLILKVARKRSVRIARFLQALSRIVRGRGMPNSSLEKLVILRYPRLLLVIAMTVAALLACFPYLPSFNPNGNVVGTDASTYIDWTRQMLARPFPQAISYAFSSADQGFRPLPLVLFYSIASLGLQPQQVVRFSPVIFGPLLALSIFIFVRIGSGNSATAALAASITPFSFDITVGIWADYLANWLAMIIAFFFLSAIFLFARSDRKIIIVPLLLLSLALLLTHPWTWALIMVTTLAFALTSPRSQRRLLTKPTIVLILVGITVDFAKNELARGTTLAADLGTKAPVFGVSNLLMFWPNTFAALNIYYDGLLGNALILALSAIPFIVIRFQNKMEAILVCWVACVSVPFALLNSFHQTRLLYDMPNSPLMAIGLVLIMSRIGGGNLRASLLLLVALLFGTNYALGAVVQA